MNPVWIGDVRVVPLWLTYTGAAPELRSIFGKTSGRRTTHLT